ncbi:MAG: MMPL family transporter [Solirubrobacterales bacterium]|nr:MMPL family transporter [Solirubrobacterales bacterium]
MKKLARWTMAHRRIVVVAWIAATVGVFAVSSSVGKKTASDFTLPGTGTQHALDLLRSKFAAQAGDADQIVFHARAGTLKSRGDRAAIGTTLARVAHLPHVTSVVSPYAPGTHAISRDETIAFATVTFDERANVLPKPAVDRVISTAEASRSPQLQVELGGQAIEQAQQTSLGFATVVGILAAIIILLISLGSFSAMGLPIATALLGLGVGVGLITLASHVIDMPDFASELALMIGLGVGIDYALFIVTRFRENYRKNGGDVQRAAESAMNTSGRAVLFAGVTVVIALLGMFALGVSVLNGAAVAAAIGVVLVLGASLTLLPALLSFAGRRIGEAGRRRAGGDGDDVRPGFWLRWVRQVQRRPVVTAVAATALMLVLAAPALGLRLGSSDAGNDPTTHTTRKAYDLLAEGFGRGFNGPLQVAVALPSAHDSAALTELDRALRSTPGVASAASPRVNPTGTAAAVLVYPTTSPQSAQTSNLVTRLRDRTIPPIERATDARIFAGGSTASQIDFSHILAAKLPVFIAVVVGLAALLLLIVFRSLVIPVQAAVMNLLSIGASLGVVQAIFERGWLGGLFGIDSGPIDAFIPVIMFAVVFGLSMDYEVFLISRVREEWEARSDASAAIREGLARTGRVITAAAAVMIAVFFAFAISGTRVLEMFGLAMATAVFLDAIVIRLVLLPAVLQLLGRTTWALPSWLDRSLPRVAIDADPGPGPRPTLEPALEAGS